MIAITSFFLRAKHWQIFAPLFGLYTTRMAIGMASFPTVPSSPDALGLAGFLFGTVMVAAMLCILIWFWSLGSFLSSIVRPVLRLNSAFFRFAVIYPCLYMFAFIPFFLDPRPSATWVAIIVPFHFFAMLCMFYNLYFVSKNLALAETGRAASFYDYAGPFFLIWFFPLGIWVIQPRINRLYAMQSSAEPLSA